MPISPGISAVVSWCLLVGSFTASAGTIPKPDYLKVTLTHHLVRVDFRYEKKPSFPTYANGTSALEIQVDVCDHTFAAPGWDALNPGKDFNFTSKQLDTNLPAGNYYVDVFNYDKPIGKFNTWDYVKTCGLPFLANNQIATDKYYDFLLSKPETFGGNFAVGVYDATLLKEKTDYHFALPLFPGSTKSTTASVAATSFSTHCVLKKWLVSEVVDRCPYFMGAGSGAGFDCGPEAQFERWTPGFCAPGAIEDHGAEATFTCGACTPAGHESFCGDLLDDDDDGATDSKDPDCCVPQCAGKCGQASNCPGKLCPGCTLPAVCTKANICCVPKCDGAKCGPETDGCGGACIPPDGTTCDLATKTPVPNAAGCPNWKFASKGFSGWVVEPGRGKTRQPPPGDAIPWNLDPAATDPSITFKNAWIDGKTCSQFSSYLSSRCADRTACLYFKGSKKISWNGSEVDCANFSAPNDANIKVCGTIQCGVGEWCTFNLDMSTNRCWTDGGPVTLVRFDFAKACSDTEFDEVSLDYAKLTGNPQGGVAGGGSKCGNGVLDPGEFCDGTQFGGATCDTLDYSTAGVLKCSTKCTFVVSSCGYGCQAKEKSCSNGADDDCDGAVDGEDTECGGAGCSGQEICDGKDNDCDGKVDTEDFSLTGCSTYYEDDDGDGYGGINGDVCMCGPSGVFTSTNSDDCNDSDGAVSPAATESCGNGVDEDCDGYTDVDDRNGPGCTPYYLDVDQDGYGQEGDIRCACGPLGIYSTLVAGDCNDYDPKVHAVLGAEQCGNGLDDDCDGKADWPDSDCGGINPICGNGIVEGAEECDGSAIPSSCQAKGKPSGQLGCVNCKFDTSTCTSCAATEDCTTEEDDDCDGTHNDMNGPNCKPFYVDMDKDGCGAPSISVCQCYATNAYPAAEWNCHTDCDDSNPLVDPEDYEHNDICGDDLDNDCNGTVDDGCGPVPGEPCDDGIACTTGDVVTETGDCIGFPSDAACSDENVCTNNWCNVGVGCQWSYASGPCVQNPAVCTHGDYCEAGACKAGLACECTSGAQCNDGSPCTLDVCDNGSCTHPAVTAGAACSDGNACTLGDTCASGTCKGGSLAPACADTDQDGYTPNQGDCDDHDASARPGLVEACDGKDNDCDAVVDDGVKNPCGGCGAVLEVCGNNLDDDCDGVPDDGCAPCAGKPNGTACQDDGNPCTGDSCQNGVCTHPKVSGSAYACSDNDPCTTGDVCVAGACVGTVTNCNDGNDCTTDACVPATGACTHAKLSGASCSDGSACTSGDACANGTCAGVPVVCNDSNPCTNDSCAPASGCQTVNNTAACSDGNACTAGDACQNGSCKAGALVCACQTDADCPDDADKCNGSRYCNVLNECATKPGSIVTCPASANACQKNACQPATGTCLLTAVGNGTLCSDGSACTASDVCVAGACQGQPVTCNDGNPCTSNECVPASGCSYPAASGACPDDGNACTSDACSQGACAHGALANGTACSDGNPCTQGDTCTSGTCAGAGLVCNDSNPCTSDSCASGQCVFTPSPGACSDGSACTTNDSCASGTCKGTPVPCDDGLPCTVDGCAAASGCTHAAQTGGSCSDGNACTTGDVCQAGLCSGTAAACNDGNPCTQDSCASSSGCTHVATAYTESCYSGPAATKGVGACKPGVRSCSGGSLGACVGEVVPIAEVCGNSKDDDCDGYADGTCSPAGGSQTASCGMCGTQSRTCGATCLWGAWTTCMGQSGVCMAGTQDSVACGNCGSRIRTCTSSCVWSWGQCQGEGACAPGAKTSCWTNGNPGTLTCSAGCAWGTCIADPSLLAIKLSPDNKSILLKVSAFYLHDGTNLATLVASGTLCAIGWAYGEAWGHQEISVSDSDGDGWVEYLLPNIKVGLKPYPGCSTCADGLPFRFSFLRCGTKDGGNPGYMQYTQVDSRLGEFSWTGADDNCCYTGSLAVAKDAGTGVLSPAGKTAANVCYQGLPCN